VGGDGAKSMHSAPRKPKQMPLLEYAGKIIYTIHTPLGKNTSKQEKTHRSTVALLLGYGITQTSEWGFLQLYRAF